MANDKEVPGGDVLRLVPKGTASEHAALLEKMRQGLPQWVELSVHIAEYRFTTYQAYLKAGFSEDQALRLVQSEIMRPV